MDFAIIGAVHDHMVAVGTYGPNIMEYILLSGVKDIIVLYFLNVMSANTTIKVSYLIAGLFLIITWFLMNYYRDLAVYFYRYRGFLVIVTMLMQVYGLTQNGGIKRNNRKTVGVPRRYVINRLSWPEWSNTNVSAHSAGINSSVKVNKGQG